VELPIHYKGTQVDGGYKLDIVVERQIVVELKAVERVLPIHIAQLMTYLKLSGRRVGLLINFNVQSLKEGITRRVI
jgi:GxxExxY protein